MNVSPLFCSGHNDKVFCFVRIFFRSKRFKLSFKTRKNTNVYVLKVTSLMGLLGGLFHQNAVWPTATKERQFYKKKYRYVLGLELLKFCREILGFGLILSHNSEKIIFGSLLTTFKGSNIF